MYVHIWLHGYLYKYIYIFIYFLYFYVLYILYFLIFFYFYILYFFLCFFLYFYLFVNLLFIFLYVCPLYFNLRVRLHFPIKTISSKVFKNNVKKSRSIKMDYFYYISNWMEYFIAWNNPQQYSKPRTDFEKSYNQFSI